MTIDAFSHKTAFGNFNGTGNDRIEDPNALAECFTERFDDLFGIPRMNIRAGNEDAVNHELLVDRALDLVDRSEQLRQSPCGEISRMRGNDYAVCGDKRVDDHQTEGGETVNQDVVVLAFEDIDDSLQDVFAVHRAVESDFHAEQIIVRGDEVNAFSAADDPDMRIARLSHHIPVHDCCEADGEIVKIVHTERDGQTALRISIDQKDFLASASQSDSQVQNGCRLTDAALLIHYCNDFCVFHGFMFSFRWLI